ncbi:MAG TPA: hypothetical protein VMV46_21370 [Thermoanaerobaculia bacterium]|nr:hypothetical protein [Thermoanaerobaculia bacterium]
MIRITRHRLTTTLAVAWLALAAVSPALAAADATGDAAAFEALKALAGEWRGTYGAGGGGMRFEVTSGGHTVVQTEFPGEAHEMRTLYWLEDGELVAQHFCMLGNQPRYEVESADGGATLRYVFAGGSNLDPETDQHAHEGVLRIGLDDVLESTWTFWKDGGPHETNTFRLERTK